jgi:hypothetical protein
VTAAAVPAKYRSRSCRAFARNTNSTKSSQTPIMKSSHSEEKHMAEPTYEELKARLAELEKQPRQKGSMEFRVSEKGGVSVYGLGRFPVTLYYEQWTRLLEAADKLREFLEENKSKLKLKDQ